MPSSSSYCTGWVISTPSDLPKQRNMWQGSWVIVTASKWFWEERGTGTPLGSQKNPFLKHITSRNSSHAPLYCSPWQHPSWSLAQTELHPTTNYNSPHPARLVGVFALLQQFSLLFPYSNQCLLLDYTWVSPNKAHPGLLCVTEAGSWSGLSPKPVL